MKKLISVLFMVTILSISSYSQTFKFHISNIFQFKHLNVISTEMAIEHGYVKLDTMSITNSDYIFDFDSMTVTLINHTGGTAKRKLVGKKIDGDSFETYFIDSPNGILTDVIYSEGIMCVRWIENTNNIEYMVGWLSKVNK